MVYKWVTYQKEWFTARLGAKVDGNYIRRPLSFLACLLGRDQGSQVKSSDELELSFEPKDFSARLVMFSKELEKFLGFLAVRFSEVRSNVETQAQAQIQAQAQAKPEPSLCHTWAIPEPFSRHNRAIPEPYPSHTRARTDPKMGPIHEQSKSEPSTCQKIFQHGRIVKFIYLDADFRNKKDSFGSS